MSGVKGTRWAHHKPCGTKAAYKRHIRSREVPCEPCRLVERDASRDAMRARRAAEAQRRAGEQARIDALLLEVVAVLAAALEVEDRCERCPACLRSLSPRRRTCQRCGAQVARAAA